VRYVKGGYFKEHVDVTRDHPVLGHRRLSVVIFCNDDFVGGNLVFPRQDITITPEKGLMVLFPSGFTHPHELTEITDGIKYSIVSWFFALMVTIGLAMFQPTPTSSGQNHSDVGTAYSDQISNYLLS